MSKEDRFRFRVWYGNQEVSIFNGTEVMINQNGDIRALYRDEWCDTSNLDVEVCTGIKDIDGNLIYEGDIVNFGGYKAQVMWSKKCYMFCVSDNNEEGFPIYMINGDDIKNCKILGNVHENPEFLKGKGDE